MRRELPLRQGRNVAQLAERPDPLSSKIYES